MSKHHSNFLLLKCLKEMSFLEAKLQDVYIQRLLQCHSVLFVMKCHQHKTEIHK